MWLTDCIIFLCFMYSAKKNKKYEYATIHTANISHQLRLD